MTCDRCVGLSFIDRFHLACLSRDEEDEPPFSVRVKFFLKEFSTFHLICSAEWRQIPSLGLSSNQRTEIIVSSLFGFSKSWMISFTMANFSGYPVLMNDRLMTSAFQLVAIRFSRCKAPRVLLRFHLSGIAK